MPTNLLIVFVLTMTLSGIAQRVTAEPTPPVKIRLDELMVSGTTTLGSEQLNEITNSLTGREYRDDANEMSERLRNAFQERGYFHPEIKNFKVRALDPLGNPKPVRIEAEVNEGPRYRLGAIEFRGTRAFSPQQLASAMPIHAGEYFDVEKVRTGLTAILKFYKKQGYLLAVPVPETKEGSDATITLTFNVDEGQQFRMGTVEFAGDRDLAAHLKSSWQLAAGTPFDSNYVREFVDENKTSLPHDFNYMNDVQVDMNCRDGIADIRINADPKHPGMEPSKSVGCDTPSKKESGEAN